MLCCRKKAADVNKKLGDKFEISETELMSTIEACNALLTEGQDLDTGEAATQVGQIFAAVTYFHAWPLLLDVHCSSCCS